MNPYEQAIPKSPWLAILNTMIKTDAPIPYSITIGDITLSKKEPKKQKAGEPAPAPWMQMR